MALPTVVESLDNICPQRALFGGDSPQIALPFGSGLRWMPPRRWWHPPGWYHRKARYRFRYDHGERVWLIEGRRWPHVPVTRFASLAQCEIWVGSWAER